MPGNRPYLYKTSRDWLCKDLRNNTIAICICVEDLASERCERERIKIEVQWFHVTAIDIALSLNRFASYLVLSFFLVRFKIRKMKNVKVKETKLWCSLILRHKRSP